MKKVYFLLLLCCSSLVALSQTSTLTIFSTAGAGSFITGNATSTGARNDGNIVTTAATQRGYAVFSLSGLPAGATITAVTLGFYVQTFGGAGTAGGWNTRVIAQDLSTVTTAATLFADMAAGTSVAATTYGGGAGNGTVAFNAAGTAFMTTEAGATISVCWTGGNGRVYTITGETGTAASTTAVDHAPYLLITYCAPPTAVTATAAPTGLCVGSTLTLTGTATGATSFAWTGPGGFDATTESTTSIVTAASTGVYTLTATNTCGAVTSTTSATTAAVTVNTAPAPIAGGPNVCTGQTTLLTDATTGGTWSISSAAVATITATGTLSGVGAGSAIVTYSLGTGCTDTMTINDFDPPANITGGATVICVGSTLALNEATTGGTWSSSSNVIATVSATGVVTAVSGGSATISYIMPSRCFSTANIIVNPSALPAAIVGPTTECVGSNVTLTDGSPAGNWSSSAAGTAQVYPTGVVYGISAGTATITYTLAASGCYVTAPMTVVATPPAITGTLSACIGTTTTLADAETGGTWSSTNTTVATIDPATGIVTGVALGTTTISYIVPPGCAVIANVAISALPAAIAGSAVVCTGGTTTLTDATAGGGTWSSSNLAAATVGLTTGVVSGVAEGAATITFTSAAGCTATAVINDSDPPAAITGGAVSVCAGGTVTLADATTGGTWSSTTAATIATVDPTGVVSAVGAGVATISYTVANSCSVTALVTVNPLPGAIAGNLNVCTTLTTALTDAVTGGTWSSSAPATATVDSVTGVVTGLLAGTATITYTLGTGCVITATITDSDPPVAITGGAVALCVGATVTLGETTTGGTWTSSNITVATTGSTGIVTGAGAGVDTVIYTLASSCFAETTLTVNPVPVAIAGNLTVCTGLTSTLTDATTGGTWSVSDATIATIGSTTGVVTGVLGGTTTVSYTLGTGCAATATITDSDPPVAITGGSVAICALTTVALVETTTGGTWTSSNLTIATIDQTGLVTGVAGTGGPDTLIYTLASGCFADAMVTVNPIPAPITGNTIVCTGNTTTLADATTGGTWSSSDATVATVDPASGVVTGVSAAAGTATISYTLTTTGCFVTTTITDNDPPGVITGTSVVCVLATTTLTGTGGGTWASSDNTIATVDPASGIVTGVAQGIANISYILASGCFVTDPVTVNPIPMPVTGPTSVCTGSSITIGDITPGGTWSTSDATIASVDVTGTTTTTVTGEGAGTATISFTITATGCFVTETMTDTDPPVAIVGASTVCEQATILLTDLTAGGTWISSDVSRATIDNASGLVTGVSAGTTTISYILSATGCFITAPLTVNPIPAAITGATVVCTGGTTTLGDVTVLGTWSSSNLPVVTIDPAAGTVTGVSFGTATISYTLATGCFVTSTMQDNDPPTPVVGTSLICVGATITFTDAVAGGAWTSEFPLIASADPFGDIFGSSPGTDSIFYTVPACPYVSFPVTVNPAPTAISGPNTVCVGDTILLTDGTTGGFWASGNPLFAFVDTLGNVTGESSGVLSINYTTGGCAPASYQITVNPEPTAIAGLTHVCATLTTVLTDGVPGGLWGSTDPTKASIDPSLGVVTGVSAGTVTITYMLPAGCFKTLTFTVNPLPATITYPTAIVCQGSVITFSDATPGGAWSSGTTAVATVGTGAGLITGVTAGTANIIYTLPTGCLEFATVTVNPLPVPSTGPFPSQVCVDATTVLVNSSPGGPGSWSSSSNSIATVGVTTGIVTGVATGTVTIIYSLPTGCNIGTVMTVNPLPAAIFGLSSVCVGSSIILTDATPGGDWTSGSGAATISSPASGVINGSSAGVANINYTLTATGCSVSTPLTVDPLPSPIAGPTTACVGTTLLFTDTDPGGLWSSTVTTYVTIDSASGRANAVSAGFTNIIYTFPSGCSTSLGLTTEIAPVATVTASGVTTFCAGGSVVLSATAGTFTYQWFDNGVAVAGAIGPNYSATTTGSYTVLVTNAFGCSDTSSDTIAVFNGITAVLNYAGSASICAGNNLLFTTNTGGASGAITYLWQDNGVIIPGAVSSTYDATTPGVYNSQVTVSGASGFCTVTSDSVTVTVHALPVPLISFDGTSLATTGGYTNYHWFLNTVGIPGADDSSYVPLTNGSYRVLVVDANGCDGYSAAYVIANTGVKQVGRTDVKIYPNPATSVVHIETSVTVRAVITAMDGKVLLDQANAKDVNISNLADGMYLIMIYDENGNQLMVDKLIKE